MKEILIPFVVLLNMHLFAQKADLISGEFAHSRSNVLNMSPHEELKHKYDVAFYRLDLDLEVESSFVSGNAEVHAKVVNELDTIVLDLFDSLYVDSVFINGEVNLSYAHADNELIIPCMDSFSAEDNFIVQVFYRGDANWMNNDNYYGISAREYLNSGYNILETHSECYGSMHWWPCKQVVADKADSVEVVVTTDSANLVASNGLLVDEEIVDNNKKQFTWKSNYPIAYYLISIMISPGYSIHETYINYGLNDSVLMQSFLINDSSELYNDHLLVVGKTKSYMTFLSDLYGEYPFAEEKYGYAIGASSLGAMENQTMTMMGYETMDTIAGFYSGYHYWYSMHELGHHWFGDNVTCATWQDIWINEGFASYTEYLGLEHFYEQEEAAYWMSVAHNKVITIPTGSIYVPESFLNATVFDIIDYRLAYKKGAAFVHMIRHEVNNDSLFFKTLKDFQIAYADSVATGDDFREVLELNIGRSFEVFFNQWYYGEGYPLFNVAWSQEGEQLEINLKQTTSTNITPLYQLHIELKIVDELGNDSNIRVFVDQLDNNYQLSYPDSVIGINVDPNNWIINELYSPVEIEENSERSINIYPNPASDYIIVENIPANEHARLTIFNSMGKEVLSSSIRSNKNKIEISSLPKGVYIIRLTAGTEMLQNMLIIH